MFFVATSCVMYKLVLTDYVLHTIALPHYLMHINASMIPNLYDEARYSSPVTGISSYFSVCVGMTSAD